MAREVFVDSSAWIALADDADRYHRRAARAYPGILEARQRLVTTNLVVAETYIVLRRGLSYDAAIAFLDSLEGSLRIRKVYSDASLEEAAAALLRRFSDQDFSFTDAVSFVAMREEEIEEAFAFDRHFATAGFRLLP